MYNLQIFYHYVFSNDQPNDYGRHRPEYQQAVSQSKAAKSVAEKESKEVREKREKMEKLLKKAEDATGGKRYSEALTWLRQAKRLAMPDKQKEIDVKIAEERNR